MTNPDKSAPSNAEITTLRAQLEEARKGCLDGVTGTSIDPERPSCLLVHFDHDVTEDDRERIRSAHNSVVTLRAQLEEARAALDRIRRICPGAHKTAATAFFECQAIADRALLHGSTK